MKKKKINIMCKIKSFKNKIKLINNNNNKIIK